MIYNIDKILATSVLYSSRNLSAFNFDMKQETATGEIFTIPLESINDGVMIFENQSTNRKLQSIIVLVLGSG